MSKDGFSFVSISEEVDKKITGYKKSRFNDLVKREYSNGDTKLVVEGARLNRTGVSQWDTSDIYTDNKGYTMTFTRDSMGNPLSISIQVPNGSEMTKYVINQQTLSRYDNINPMEANRIFNKTEQKVKKGASIEEIARDFSDYQRSPYSREELKEIDNQKSINEEIKAKYDKLMSKGNFGIHTFETISKDFDKHMQSKAVGAPTIMLSQNDRDVSGRLDDKISFSTLAAVTYSEKSKDVSEIRLSTIDYRQGISGSPSYDEVLNIETLMKKGYDRDTAQQKLNDVMQQIYDGKPLKEIFISNKQFLTEKSEKLFAQNLEKQRQDRIPNYIKTPKTRG
ncbi:MAG: hypothetical protein J6C85_02030 [Alphaproteobacteria bacterium]|nr:hypothetical protein [Alphaproteobacteria bacterium]